jgi:hypothetical protein
MKPGEFTEFLSVRSSQSSILQAILNIDGPDFRMRDVDLLLRMISYSYRLDEYKGNLKAFLDETHDLLNANWVTHGAIVIALVDQIEDALTFLADNFGGPQYVGRRIKNGDKESAINRALLDVQLASALPLRNRKIFDEKDLSLAEVTYEVCMGSAAFVEAISGTTKSVSAVRTRYRLWKEAIEAHVGVIEMAGGV